MTPIGQMDRLVTIQKITQSRGTGGFPVETATTLGTEFMAMEPLGAGNSRYVERFTAEQLSASGNTRWKMHYRADMDPESNDVPKTRRLLYRGRTYDIVSAQHLGLREGIQLQTLEKVG